MTSERSILVFPDNAQKHAQYDEQVVQTFYVSHADVTELTQLLSSLIRLPSMAVQPAIQFNKTANTITVRGTTSVVQIIEKVIAQNDKARAEIMFDVEILEVNRNKAKQYGLNLSEYALGGVLSPEVRAGRQRIGLERHDHGRRQRELDDDGDRWTLDAAVRRAVAAAVQPEHDLARVHDVGLLPRRPDRHRACARERHADQARRQAAAARRRGQQAHAEPRRGSPDRLDELHTDRHRRRRASIR